jgi:hypothetical protein
MPFKLVLSDEAKQNLALLEKEESLEKRLKAVRKALGYLCSNPRHPSLNTHKFESLNKQYGQEVFEAYAENSTPKAYRIFWHYGPGKGDITVISIVPHP